VNTYFIRAVFDIECQWVTTPPIYRIYVNDELFSEKEWRWSNNNYLEQLLQIQAPPGKYIVRVDTLNPNQARFTTSNHRIEYGPARWQKQHKIIIQP